MKYSFFLTILFTLSMFSQQPVKQDSSLFDFWVGKWDLTWNDPDGSIAKGQNIISKILDGKVIHEDFSGLTGQSKAFKGESFSVLDQSSGTWRQTWVDNQSAYLPFIGGRDGETPFFEREFERNGKVIKQKMVFRDITHSSFIWDWMNSQDGGKTWNVAWTINYQRKP